MQVPSQLKIDHLVMKSLGYETNTLNSSNHIKNNLIGGDLVIFTGLGAPKKIFNEVDSVSAAELQAVVSANGDPRATLRSFQEKSPLNHRNIWSTTLDKFEKEPFSCQYDHLAFESSPGSIVVRGLHSYLKNSDEITTSCFTSLLALIVQQRGISALHFRFPKRAFNQNGKSIIQTESFSSLFPYTLAGIDGAGEIIGVADTGLDELNCFFRNEDESLVTRSSYKAPTFDLTKRKVIQYINFCDDSDTVEGHGTHVSGTVAGKVIGSDPSMEIYNGHASAAKIAFFDMEYSSYPALGLHYPLPFDKYVLSAAYAAGAKLHTNSWGSVFNAYDSTSLSIDSFLYDNPDFLALFAASNDGAEGYYSIGNPAVAKNILTVGASQSSYATDIGKVAYFSALGPTFDNRIKPDIVAPGYSTISAKATGHKTCSVIPMAGTSMATPAVRLFFSFSFL